MIRRNSRGGARTRSGSSRKHRRHTCRQNQASGRIPSEEKKSLNISESHRRPSIPRSGRSTASNKINHTVYLEIQMNFLSVVMIEPQYHVNVGHVARLMKNFGL